MSGLASTVQAARATRAQSDHVVGRHDLESRLEVFRDGQPLPESPGFELCRRNKGVSGRGRAAVHNLPTKPSILRFCSIVIRVTEQMVAEIRYFDLWEQLGETYQRVS
jgi:hypothetical protein